jgi:microcystin-dependent protein
MALPFYNWSRTASSNASADSTVNWAEGQAPSSVNDSARAMMASTAAYRDDIAGNITTGGSATAYTVSSFQVFDTLAHLHGQKIAFIAHATNTNAVGVDVTLNVDSLGAKSIRMAPSIALPNGTLVLGTPYVVTYNNTDGVFYLQNMTNPYNIPLAAGFDFWGTSTPNSSFAFPTGQAISRTTYATLFSIMSTTYGVGDGSTTFNLPDKTGRASVMKEASATRLTSTYFGGDSTAMGAVGGAESQTLTLAQLPTGITSAGTFSVSGNVVTSDSQPTQFSANAGSQVWKAWAQAAGLSTTTTTASGTATSNNTSGDAHRTVQPTIVCNYILRII